jgi:hypothetical protein
MCSSTYISILFLSTRQIQTKASTRKSSRPDCLEHRCPFSFNVYYSPSHHRWFIPKDGDGSSYHNGHIPLAPDEVHMSSTNLDENVLKRVIAQLDSNVSISVIRTLLQSETGSNLSYQQIRALHPSTVTEDGDTPAQRLMNYLESSDHIRFVALTANKDRGSLITIRTTKKDRSFNAYTSDNDSTQDPDSNANTYAAQAMKALRLKDNETLLLGVAWITEEGK